MVNSASLFLKKNNLIQSQPEGIAFHFSIKESQLTFSIEISSEIKLEELFVEFELESPITEVRSTSYQWAKPKDLWRANTHSPKIIRCEDGHTMVSKTVQGCWEVASNLQRLRWYFYHPELTPLMVYDQEDRRVFLKEQAIQAGTVISDSILWSKGEVEEWSRTPLGFVPIVCFTDHSDFDTCENLKIQREFLKNLGIRVTKGFFLFDYTHKKENASFENEESKSELILWEKDGHELAYHALSQSYRGEISENEFKTFMSPSELKPITTYIDHGFHPYNFTKQNLGDWDSWYQHMEGKGIQLIWSYLDSGEGNLFAVNQLNSQGFTLQKILNSAKEGSKLGIKRSAYSTLRNLIMFGLPEQIFWSSKYLKGSLFSFKKSPSLKGIFNLLSKAGDFGKTLLLSGVFANWKSRMQEIFPTSGFSPLFFKAANQKNTAIWVFQTLFVRDFEVVFSELALKRLIEENGAMIAHTYFSYANPGHEGRLFEDESWKIRPQTADAFSRLSELIRSEKIWNPTLKELKSYFDQISQLEYQLEGDRLVIKKFNGITRPAI